MKAGDMAQRSKTIPVKDGWVKREAVSGRLIAVGTDKGVWKATARSEAAISAASTRHASALKRLADR
jgi:hypothetical protein